MEDAREPGTGPDNDEYKQLIVLEELETLLEELEEQDVSGLAANEVIPDQLRARMDDLGVHDVQQLRDRIMHLHAEIDGDQDELTISDS
jgi:hypothetical protein